MRGCWSAPLTVAPADGLGLFAPLDPVPAANLASSAPSEEKEAAAPRRLVEAPAVSPSRVITAPGRRSAEREGRHHIDGRTVR